MATTTENLGMTLPDTTDPVDVTVLNSNFSELDTFAGEQTEKDTEQDDRLTALEEGKVSVTDIYGIKEALANGTDLDAVDACGSYCCSGAAVAATLLHCPTATEAFIMYVDYVAATMRVVQRLYAFLTTTGVPCIYMRVKYSAGWGSWYRFDGTVVS